MATFLSGWRRSSAAETPPFTSHRSALLTNKIQDDHDFARSSLPQLSKPKTAKKALKLKFRVDGFRL
jgi:hypothetical protein